MTTIQKFAATYLDQGWALCTIPAGQKAANDSWNKQKPTAESFAGFNIAFRCGKPSGGLVDIDLDRPSARVVGKHPDLFGICPAFGRKEHLHPGHRLVICTDPLGKKFGHVHKFTLPKKDELLSDDDKPKETLAVLEVRAGGCYTVIPPSRHSDTEIVWTGGEIPKNDSIPQMTWDQIRERAWLTTFLAVCLEFYPAEGERDDYIMPVAGAMIYHGITVELAERMIEHLCILAGDTDEIPMRTEKAARAHALISEKAQCTGMQTLGQDRWGPTGPKIAKKLRDFLATSKEALQIIPQGSVDCSDPDLDRLRNTLVAAINLVDPQLMWLRMGSLVRLRRIKEDEQIHHDTITLRAGTVELVNSDKGWIELATCRAGVTFYRVDSEGKPRNCKPYGLDVLLKEQETLDFLSLIAISQTPTTTRSEPGYDAEAKTLLVFEPGAFPDAPEPTKGNAQDALGRLRHPLREFPWADVMEAKLEGTSAAFVASVDEAVMISALVGGVMRQEYELYPGHFFDAPKAGSGKSMLAEIVGILATGSRPAAMTYTDKEDEMEKRLFAAHRRSPAVVNLDNINGPVAGTYLSESLTEPYLKGRPLGKSEEEVVSTRAMMLGTGNNLVIIGELVRRVVVCRLNANHEKPFTRKFDFNPVEEVRNNRTQLVVDCLTIIRAYREAGSPKPDDFEPFGTYYDWEEVRGALIWLGMADPAQAIDNAFDDDPGAEDRMEVFEAIAEAGAGEPRFSFAVSDLAKNPGTPLYNILQRRMEDGHWNAKKIGWYLRSLKDIPCGRYTLVSKTKNKRTTFWLRIAPSGRQEGMKS